VMHMLQHMLLHRSRSAWKWRIVWELKTLCSGEAEIRIPLIAKYGCAYELDNFAAFFRMVIAYKEKIGFRGQLLIEPKPKEPTRHQYDYDAQTVMAFLHTYGLEKHFKLNIEPNHTTLAGHPHEHDILFASAFKMLGSIDANTGSPDLGWDTDQFPMDIRHATAIMKGGLSPGGLNFDAKVRRESTELADMFIAHIAAMDTLARGLKNAANIISDGILKKSLQ
ncbi:unnamed protein product, partial [Meganyctiphanes norvegica]